jgi:hypothetical protein
VSQPVYAPDALIPSPSVIRFPRSQRGRALLVVAGLIVLLALPLIVGLGVLYSPRWYPLSEIAQTELRIRDVWSSHPPLIGLLGRLGTLEDPGSHPGPVSFWLLWPVWRLFGASAWSMQLSTAILNILAMGAVVWMALRRGGLRLALAMTVMLGVLAAAFGATLLEPWNAYLPVLWWITFLVAIWGVLCDDLALLPVVVFAGSFCAQTHVSYLGLVPGLLVVALLVALVTAYRKAETGAIARFWRWMGITAAVGLIMWLPPVIDEVKRSPGNLSVLRDTFLDPREDPIGMRAGLDVLLLHLNPWRVLVRADIPTGSVSGSIVAGVILLLVWLAAAVLAWRLRERALTRLNVVIGVSLLLGLMSASRIFGFVWPYLAYWAWGLNVLALLSIAWALTIAIGRGLDRVRRERAARIGTYALAVAAVVVSASFVVDASSMEPVGSDMSTTLGKLAPPAVDAMSEGSVPGGGRDGAYLVTWNDPIGFGSQGFGLVDELDRQGFHVGARENYRGAVTPHHVLDPSDATAVVHLSIGSDIEVWRAKTGVKEVASVDARTPAERAEYERLRARVFVELQQAGLTDPDSLLDSDLRVVAADTRVSVETRERVARMNELDVQAAIFVGPPEAAE